MAKKAKANSQYTNMPHALWWDDEAPGLLHERVFGTMRFLRDHDARRNERYKRLAGLYANRTYDGLEASRYMNAHRNEESDPRINVVRSMVDAVTAKIAKNRPKATFLTEGGDFSLQQKARKLEQFVWGLFYQAKIYQSAPLAFRDACVYGTGIAKVYAEPVGKDGGRVCVERVYPWEVYLDTADAYHGSPRSLFHVRIVDKQVLMRLFPKKKEMLSSASLAKLSSEFGPGTDTYAEQIVVTEAWHLPSGEGAEDGVHVIAIEEGVLAENDYEHDRFPYAFLRWADPLVGFWGDALGEEVEGLQLEINELLFKIQQIFWHNATPKILLEHGSDVDTTEIDNDVRGAIVRYTGTLPQFVTHNTVAPEVFSHLDRLYQRAYETAGISQLSAQSKKPSGLDSGAALREFNDIESERFVIRGQGFEQWFMDVAELMVSAARELHDQDRDVEVRAEDRRRRRSFLRTIKWSDVDMDRDAFQMKILAASSLPQSPAGRKAAVESLYTAGLIDQTTAMSLLDFPDLQATIQRELAPYEIVLDQIEMMIDEGEYEPPEPFQDLVLAQKIVQHAYLRAKMDRVPEERLQMLRDYLDAVSELGNAAANAQAPAPTPTGGTAQPVSPVQQAPATQGMAA